jgi:hypothetical protein
MNYKAAATSVVKPIASSLIHDSIYILKVQIADLYSRIGGEPPVTKVTDTLAKINFVPETGYDQVGWQSIINGVTGDVTLLHSVIINFTATPPPSSNELGGTGCIWPDLVSNTYWSLSSGDLYVYKMAVKNLAGYDSVDTKIGCFRNISGTRNCYFKWGYNGTPQYINACLNKTGLVTLAKYVPSGNDTLYWYNDGTNYAYLNGMVIIAYHH